MKIEQIYVYPIKSLRGVAVPSATLTQHGLQHDRQFMLLKDHGISAAKTRKDGRYQNMHVSDFAEMCLFTTNIETLDNSSSSTIVVMHRSDQNDSATIKIPLNPSVNDLESMDIDMHKSPIVAYRMPKTYCEWFSARLGFEVVLAYTGGRKRTVLGNLPPNAATRNPQRRQAYERLKNGGWLSRLAAYTIGTQSPDTEEDYYIGFADCAPYLVVSETSLANVSARLADGEDMDVTKFRPNIVVSGPTKAWEEDFWAEVVVKAKDEPARLELTANCVRCASINVDYTTGKPGLGDSGKVLKKLQLDRRVDMGSKYSPCFGRYGFLARDASAEVQVKVGDQVEVTKVNKEHTVQKWPGFGSVQADDLYAL